MQKESPKAIALHMTEADWTRWFVAQNEKPFRAQQVMEWLYLHNQFNPLAFSNFSKSLREELAEEFDWSLPSIDTALKSQDGSEKILLKLHDGLLAECVLMPSENRVTLCVSSQVGCRMACTFCQTGKMGLSRNLSMGEILVQVVIANQRVDPPVKPGDDKSVPGDDKSVLRDDNYRPRKITNVVFMGMGEPLDNYDNVVAACKAMINPKIFGLSKHRVTLSTSGLIPEIERLGKDVPVALAISLHTADEEERSALMPVNRKYSLAKLKEALLKYPLHTRHGITFEYVMIKNVNDSILHAKKLVKYLHGLTAKVNLIPMNSHPGSTMVATDMERMRDFQKYLADRFIPAPVRYSRGQDVSGACGQLAAKRKDELHLLPRLVALARRREYLKGNVDKGTLHEQYKDAQR